jgi:hypothetical protein
LAGIKIFGVALFLIARRLLDQVGGDHRALDLVGALVDLGDLMLNHKSLLLKALYKYHYS